MVPKMEVRLNYNNVQLNAYTYIIMCKSIHSHLSMLLCTTTVYCAYTFIYFIHNCSYQTDQLCSYQKTEVKNWKNDKNITLRWLLLFTVLRRLRSTVKRSNQTTGKLHCVNANWAAIAEGIDTLDIILNILHFGIHNCKYYSMYITRY